MNPTAIIIVMVPFFMPLIEKAGINPIHFGLILTVNAAIGQLTPPVGVCMYISCGIARITMAEFTREITYAPVLVMFLPNLLMP